MLKSRHRGRKWLPYALLVLLVAINVSLLAVLFRQSGNFTAEPAPQDPVTSSGSIGVPTPTTSDVPTPTTSDVPTPTDAPRRSTSSDKRVKTVPAKRVLLAISSREGWRAIAGNCNTPGQLERSTDGGETWVAVTKSDLAPIVRLGIDGGNLYTVVGRAGDCSPRYIAYSPNGVIVAQTNSPRNLWFLGTSNRDQVYSPPGTRSKPCRRSHTVGLATIDVTQALVICTDGSARMTTDSGKSWTKADQLTGTIAIGSGGGHYWVAGKISSCDGVAVRRLEVRGDKLSRGPSRCARGLKITPGRVALDVSGATIWLWVGNKIYISTDAGRTWPQ